MSYEVVRLYAVNGYDESSRYMGCVGTYLTHDIAEAEMVKLDRVANFEHYGRIVSSYLEVDMVWAIKIFGSPKDIYFRISGDKPLEVTE